MVVEEGLDAVSAGAVEREMVGRDRVDGVKRAVLCSWRAAEEETFADEDLGLKKFAIFAAALEVDVERFRGLLLMWIVVLEDEEEDKGEGDMS